MAAEGSVFRMERTLPPKLHVNGLGFFRDPVGVVRTGVDRHGPVFAMRMGPKHAVVIAGPEECREVLAQPESVLPVRPVYQWVKPMFGDVMQAAEHTRYLHQRAALLPALRAHHMDEYAEVMAEETAKWISNLTVSGQFDAVHDLERLSLDIAARLFLGAELMATAWDRKLFLQIAAGMEFLLPANFPAPRLMRRNRAKKELFRLMRPRLADVRADPDPARFGFLAQLAQAGEALDDDTAIGLILILVYAAYETTAAQLAWVLTLLLQHPDWLESATAEAAAGGGRRPDVLHRCILEAQRLHPVTTMLTRHTACEYRIAGYDVPVGWLTLCCPPVAHRSPALYPNPDVFDPDRFSAARDPAGHAAACLVNMGAGAHACLGGRFAEIEMSTVLRLLIQRYSLTLPSPPTARGGMGLARPNAPCLVRYQQREPASRKH